MPAGSAAAAWRWTRGGRKRAGRWWPGRWAPLNTDGRCPCCGSIDAQLDDRYGAGAVPRPSTAAAYRHLARLTKGTNAVKGSAKGRRSIADRPKGVYGRLRAVRPGEYVILDTQDLDVFAMEPVTCRWCGPS